MTEYIVFGYTAQREDGDEAETHYGPSGWSEIGRARARSASSAISTVLEKALLQAEMKTAGSFVAVPARSWKPVTVKVETKTALKFS